MSEVGRLAVDFEYGRLVVYSYRLQRFYYSQPRILNWMLLSRDNPLVDCSTSLLVGIIMYRSAFWVTCWAVTVTSFSITAAAPRCMVPKST